LETVDDEPEPDPRLVLVQALAKGGRDEQAVETATELGVDEVVPWQAARGVVVWRGREREEKGRRRWESVCVAATKQSRRSRVPVVAEPVGTVELAARLSTAAVALVLHETATESLAGVDLPDHGDVVVVVGPEGGISDTELAALVAAGGRPVRLGPEVLRSSTAGPVALAVLASLARWH
jgi:16S rRNA (uracil1498-N3)-methyltransferase